MLPGNTKHLIGLTLGLMIVLSSARPAFAYDRGSAGSYADSWWNGRNGAYPTYGDDCTNFVSQSLHAGGEAFVGGPNNYGDQYWWVDTANGLATHSWSVSYDLDQFLTNNSGRAVYGGGTNPPANQSGTDGADVGDVLLYDWGQGQGISHASVQVVNNGTDPNYRYSGSLIDQHTNDRYHEIWTLYPTNSLWPSTTVLIDHMVK